MTPFVSTSDSKITFEFPLNERFRTFLRIENLLNRWQYYLRSTTKEDHHTAILTLLDIYDFSFRNDVKGDLLSELARYKQALSQYFTSPDVSEEKLNQTILRLVDAYKQIEQSPKFGGSLAENEWLINIKSRLVVSASVCSFDMGFYYQWLQDSEQRRLNDLHEWVQPFVPMFDAVTLLLQLSRNLALTKDCVTNSYAYQQPLSGRKFDIMRVEFANTSNYLPDFSANKHVIWLRFAAPVVSVRSSAKTMQRTMQEEVAFRLGLCGVPATSPVAQREQVHPFYSAL